jgi:hypothetical protein
MAALRLTKVINHLSDEVMKVFRVASTAQEREIYSVHGSPSADYA